MLYDVAMEAIRLLAARENELSLQLKAERESAEIRRLTEEMAAARRERRFITSALQGTCIVED